MTPTEPSRRADEAQPDPRTADRRAPPAPSHTGTAEDLDLDLDLEEADDGDRLKEGFTGQER